MPANTASEEYRNLLAAQRTLAADIENPSTEPKDRASCARVLVAVIDQKRIMRMKPKPRDVDTTKLPRRTRSSQTHDAPSFIELHEQPAPSAPTPETKKESLS